ncbi:MAG: hypothetical protein RL508_66 [Actinomycetota bacterium]|jgi:para-nitrobenzyl esterase
MPNPIATTAAGTIEGSYVGDQARYLGIPYAQAPVGDLEFEAPVKAKPFEGVFKAQEFGATPQRRPFGVVTTIPEPVIPGEDILNLNIFAPKGAKPGDNLPVLFYIHGGGFVAGSHVGSWFHGEAFNRDGVILVTISYRLGFKGFGLIEDAPNNRGLLDMVMALEWVRDNIAAFGGDPKHVTISGQSAGGGAVLCLLSMPAARGLFMQAIPHSPAPAARTVATARLEAERMAKIAGVPNTKAGWMSISEDKLIDAQLETAAYNTEHSGVPVPGLGGAIAQTLKDDVLAIDFAPVLDAATQPTDVFEALVTLNPDVPILIGATSEEFMMPKAVAQPEEVGRAVVKNMITPGKYEQDLRYAYEAEHNDPLGLAITNILFMRGIRDVLRVRPAKTYSFLFDYPSSVSGRAGHCLELPFAFDCLSDPHVAVVFGPEPNQAVADDMHAAWVSFVKTGNPGWGDATTLENRVYQADGGHTKKLVTTEEYGK